MPNTIKKPELWKDRGSVDRSTAGEWSYPTGMVWCPMKMSGMAVMKCAELQKQLGCGSLRQFRIITKTQLGNVRFFWPWLRRGRDCPERASDKEVRELRLALSPLRLVEKSQKDSRAAHCPKCHGRKAGNARQCRRCWRLSVRS